MFSAQLNQPQVFDAVIHVLSSVRAGVSGIRGRQQHQCRQQRQTSTKCGDEAVVAKQREIREMDLKQCMEVILQPEYRQKLAQLLGMLDDNPWRSHFVSAPTFFQNKTGFTEQMLLDDRAMNCVTLFVRPAVRQLLGSSTSPVYTQTRGFLRKARTEKEELSQERQHLTHLLNGERPYTQTKILQAFIQGMDKQSSKHDDNETPMKKFIKYATYGFMLLFCLNLGTKLFFGKVESKDGGPFGMNMGKLSTEVKPEEKTHSFKDVRGCDEVKQELEDVVGFLKYPKKFEEMGAKLPKGVLMVGPPGVGKTLLAKAVAGEADVPFFHLAGSEVDGMFVGMGAKKLQKLFETAKAKAPCVIFIDEIDSVGGKRTNSPIQPYANQTINQLLAEMDGFSNSAGVLVIGATNMKHRLDKALLRPGRFDVEIQVMPPDLNGRVALFELYLSKVKADKNIDIKKLGSMSFGMTGADISNLVNQATIDATLKGHECVTQEHLDAARDKVTMGPAWKNRKISEEKKKKTASHEAGHALVAYYTEEASPLHKVTIVSRGQAVGHTSFQPKEDDSYNMTKAQLLAMIDVANGGRLGELVEYGDNNVDTGASNDFEKATQIATSMVKKFGMSEKVGTRVFHDNEVSGGFASPGEHLSPATQQLVDDEIKRILEESNTRALDLLKKHRGAHKRLTEALVKYETLNATEVDDIMKNKAIRIKNNTGSKSSFPKAPSARLPFGSPKVEEDNVQG